MQEKKKKYMTVAQLSFWVAYIFPYNKFSAILNVNAFFKMLLFPPVDFL